MYGNSSKGMFSVEEMSVKKVVGFGALAVAAVLGMVTLGSSVFTVNAGQYAVERTPTGQLIAHQKPGIKFKTPFFSEVEFYDEVTTITYSDENDGSKESQNKPYTIAFTDTYGGDVKGSFRVVLPKDPDKFIELHRAFKRYSNFVQNGAEKFTNELLSYTANQFTGESFMQGGQNEYKTRLEDQARNGLYVTRRTQVRVDNQAGIVDSDNDKPSKTTGSEAYIYQTTIQMDDHGKPVRQVNSLSQYNVAVTQVTIDGFTPQKDLQAFMTNKKEMVSRRAKLVEDQENERQQAITAKLKGDRERVEAKQQMLMEKDKAEIALSKDVEVAKLQAEREKVEQRKLADLAVIQKEKEQQIANAEKGIQKANEEAAKFGAQAILHTGLAEAQVAAAKLRAKQDASAIVLAELHLQTVQAFAGGLKDFKVEMPTYMSTGNGQHGNTNSLGVLMEAVGINNLQQLGQPRNTPPVVTK